MDYWNHDGWTDPYSSARWTERQKDYASFFKKEGYTPQVVIDGKTQLVGNQGMDVAKAIQSESQTPKTDVTIVAGSADPKGNRHFTVSTGELVGNAGGDTAEIWLVVTENGLHNSVTAGENSGQTLQHSGNRTLASKNRRRRSWKNAAVLLRRRSSEIRFQMERCEFARRGFHSGKKEPPNSRRYFCGCYKLTIFPPA